jgi:hypothetical protein
MAQISFQNFLGVGSSLSKGDATKLQYEIAEKSVHPLRTTLLLRQLSGLNCS